MNRQVKYTFLKGYWIFLEAGSQVNAYKIFDDYNRKNNNILIASEKS
jgi:hypothetical protein